MAAEFQPSDYYTSAFSILGSIGGAAFGASIAGMSRPTASSSVRSFMQWGSAGGLAGGLLGRDIAKYSLEKESDVAGPRKISTPEANACLGALGGQLLGYGIVAVANDPIHRNDRSVWAGIALGTLVGSAIGYVMPPIPLITIPPDQSRKERAHEARTSQMEPLIPVPPAAAGYLSQAESVPAEQLPPARPFLPASKLTRLDTMLMSPENDRMIASYKPVFPGEAPLTVKPLVSLGAESSGYDTAPAIQLAALAGFCLGSSYGASMGGSRQNMMTRLGVGGITGLVGGWAVARAHLSRAGAMSNEDLETAGNFLSMASAWTIAGTMAGIGSGALFRNNYPEFTIADSARVTLGFAWLGMVGGAVSTTF